MKTLNALFVLSILLLSVYPAAAQSQPSTPQPCGSSWLCGSAMARVSMPVSYTEGLSISPTGEISIGTEYATLMCCAASSKNNACALSGQQNSELCRTGRVNDIFRDINFR